MWNNLTYCHLSTSYGSRYFCCLLDAGFNVQTGTLRGQIYVIWTWPGGAWTGESRYPSGAGFSRLRSSSLPPNARRAASTWPARSSSTAKPHSRRRTPSIARQALYLLFLSFAFLLHLAIVLLLQTQSLVTARPCSCIPSHTSVSHLELYCF